LAQLFAERVSGANPNRKKVVVRSGGDSGRRRAGRVTDPSGARGFLAQLFAERVSRANPNRKKVVVDAQEE